MERPDNTRGLSTDSCFDEDKEDDRDSLVRTQSQIKRKRLRKLRKRFSRLTGQHHAVSRIKRALYKRTSSEKPVDSFSDDGDEIPTILEIDDEQLLAPEHVRTAIAPALPERLRTRQLKREYAAHVDGYALETMSLKCAALANKPVVIACALEDDCLLGCFIGAAPFGTLDRVTAETKASSLEASVFRVRKTFSHSFDCNTDMLFDDPGKFVIAARTRNFLAIAANQITGGAALRLSSDLATATSEPSPLFASPSLHGKHPDESPQEDTFDILDVEVYSLVLA